MPAVPARTMAALQASPALLVVVGDFSARIEEGLRAGEPRRGVGTPPGGPALADCVSLTSAGSLSDLKIYTSSPRLCLTRVNIEIYNHRVYSSHWV